MREREKRRKGRGKACINNSKYKSRQLGNLCKRMTVTCTVIARVI